MARVALTGFAAIAALTFGAAVAHATDPAAVKLMRDHRCYVCHADDETLAGPAFADVAYAYRDNGDAEAIVAALLRSGESGAGPWHMPPHPEISSADAQKIAHYILSLDRETLPPKSMPCRLSHQPATGCSPRS